MRSDIRGVFCVIPLVALCMRDEDFAIPESKEPKSDAPITHRGPRSSGSIHLHHPYRTRWPRRLLFPSVGVPMRVCSWRGMLGFASGGVPMRVCIPQAVLTQQWVSGWFPCDPYRTCGLWVASRATPIVLAPSQWPPVRP